MRPILSFIFAAATIQHTWAAVQPLTGSSIVNQIQSGAVLSQMGFDVKNFPSDWILKKPLNDDTAAAIEIGSSDTNSKSLLSFRTESVSAKTDLEKYVRQYLRDYNQYGFEVVGLQSLKQANSNSVIVDLNQKNKATRSRQVFYKKNDKIVMATCLDDYEQFSKTILVCNTVLNTFQWR
jgi:hypothetical protein